MKIFSQIYLIKLCMYSKIFCHLVSIDYFTDSYECGKFIKFSWGKINFVSIWVNNLIFQLKYSTLANGYVMCVPLYSYEVFLDIIEIFVSVENSYLAYKVYEISNLFQKWRRGNP